MNRTLRILTTLVLALSVAGCYGPRYHHRGWHDGYYRGGHNGPGPYRGGPRRHW